MSNNKPFDRDDVIILMCNNYDPAPNNLFQMDEKMLPPDTVIEVAILGVGSNRSFIIDKEITEGKEYWEISEYLYEVDKVKELVALFEGTSHSEVLEKLLNVTNTLWGQRDIKKLNELKEQDRKSWKERDWEGNLL